MAKKSTKNPSFESSSTHPSLGRPRLFAGLTALILAILTSLSVFDYRPEQTGLFDTGHPDANIIGIFGSTVAYYCIEWAGIVVWLIPVSLFWFAYIYFAGHNHRLDWTKYAFLFLLMLSTAVFGSIAQMELFDGRAPTANPNYYPQGMGGKTGGLIYEQLLRDFIGTVGSVVVFTVLAVFSLCFLLGDNLLRDVTGAARRHFAAWREIRAERARERAERRAIEKARREAEQAKSGKKKAGAAPPPKPEPGIKPLPQIAGGGRKAAGPDDAVDPGSAKRLQPLTEEFPPDAAPPPPAKAPPQAAATDKPTLSLRRAKVTKADAPAAETPAQPSTDPTPGSLKIVMGEQVRKAAVQLPEKRGNYVFPPMKLLAEPLAETECDPLEVHQETADVLIRTLDEFGVKVTMGEVHTGPVITRYDVYPAAGVRVERIVNLEKNLALGLKAMSVRILAPVPGKGCVGIEVPNKRALPVFIRDILESEDWVNAKGEIPIALGKEVSGKPLLADLARMPHLMIAGATGSGKTVCINAIITSLLYHSSPDDLRFVMIDPKIVELQVFNNLPHMLVPVVTDPKKVPKALRHLLNEMERRYHQFAAVGVRNIAGYNARLAKNRREAEAAEARSAEIEAALTPEERAAAATLSVPRDRGILADQPEKLPYIICLVDELADLMMVAPADIETGIARLAQLARAAGIHLILATQRPSVNVITGVIKANLPSRIAFKVASKVDSRTILDGGGADQLIGRGDMLFLPPGTADLVRAQGAFVADEEIAAIVDYIKTHNGEPEFDEQFQRTIETSDDEEDEAGGGDDNGEWDDDMVPQAIEVIRTSRRASTSMLQRRLKIGYNRAARIMELLEAEGIVGPEKGSSPRDILVDLE